MRIGVNPSACRLLFRKCHALSDALARALVARLRGAFLRVNGFECKAATSGAYSLRCTFKVVLLLPGFTTGVEDVCPNCARTDGSKVVLAAFQVIASLCPFTLR